MYNTYTCTLHTHIDIAASRLRYALFLKKKCLFFFFNRARVSPVGGVHEKEMPPKRVPDGWTPESILQAALQNWGVVVVVGSRLRQRRKRRDAIVKHSHRRQRSFIV